MLSVAIIPLSRLSILREYAGGPAQLPSWWCGLRIART